jgi:hypothetical protein
MAKRIKLWRCSGCGHDYAARDERRSCPTCWSECKQERVKIRSNSRPVKGDINAVIRQYEETNLAAARIILADPGKYAGLPLEWVRMFIDRHNHEKSKSMRAPFGTPRKPEAQTKRLAAAS